MIYIGIDNGTTGSIGIIRQDSGEIDFIKTPVISELNYQKKKQEITRINHREMLTIFHTYYGLDGGIIIGIERPMVDPRRFKQTTAALRAFESTLIAIEQFELPYMYVDSKAWQKLLLPAGIKGTANLKKASLQIGKRLFPSLSDKFENDADGILIAEYLRRTYE